MAEVPIIANLVMEASVMTATALLRWNVDAIGGTRVLWYACSDAFSRYAGSIRLLTFPLRINLRVCTPGGVNL